jgi:molybdate transport system substrate-binding protein
MRAICCCGLLAVWVTSAAQVPQREIRALSPGVTYNAGLLDLADAFMKETGTKVSVTSVGMGRIIGEIKTATPPADVVFLPLELMSTLDLDGGIKPGTYTPLGRVEVGLAVRAGAPHPDISTVDRLRTALLSSKAVMYSNPATGSMVARIVDTLLKRPEFTGVHGVISTRGEGGQALARGEGDMALQLICEIYPYKEIELVGPLPRELAAWIDTATAVSSRATEPEAALAFVRYITRPEAAAVWKAKGLARF